MMKKKRMLQIVACIPLLVCLGVYLFFKFLYVPASPKHATINFQGQKYYATSLYLPNFDDKMQHINTTLLESKTNDILKLNDFPNEKLLITDSKSQGISTWSTENLDTPYQALTFFNPSFIQYRVYNSKGELEHSVLKTMDEKSGQRLVSSLEKLIKSPPRYNVISNLNVNDGYTSTNEIYLFHDESVSINMQASLLKKGKTVYLEFTGDDQFAYWKVPNQILNLLK